MISEKMKAMVSGSSLIRAMFEEGAKMAKEFGAENVYDFSLGNPNVPAPDAVGKSIINILQNDDSVETHGYMSNAGYPDVRQKIAENINEKEGTNFSFNNILMTVGAAGGLNVILKTLLNPGDEVVVFAPYFGEYKNYVSNYDGVLKVCPPDTKTFMPNLFALEGVITQKTKAVIINSPNNPTGVIYPESVIKELSALLLKKEKELSTSIYLISDEPYRELVYGEQKVPYLTKYYHNTIVGYSYSKSLSLPGERIGYLVLPDSLDDAEDIMAAASVATRILGFVNAPSLMQKAVAECLTEKTDIAYYDRNRKLLYETLTSYGFECVNPDGAFYLFVKSPIEDELAFANAAKKYNLLLVAGRAFACEGYIRIAYCVSYETIQRSLPAFKKLAEEFSLS